MARIFSPQANPYLSINPIYQSYLSIQNYLLIILDNILSVRLTPLRYLLFSSVSFSSSKLAQHRGKARVWVLIFC